MEILTSERKSDLGVFGKAYKIFDTAVNIEWRKQRNNICTYKEQRVDIAHLLFVFKGRETKTCRNSFSDLSDQGTFEPKVKI